MLNVWVTLVEALLSGKVDLGHTRGSTSASFKGGGREWLVPTSDSPADWETWAELLDGLFSSDVYCSTPTHLLGR